MGIDWVQRSRSRDLAPLENLMLSIISVTEVVNQNGSIGYDHSSLDACFRSLII